MEKDKKILVLGGTGHLGSAIVHQLVHEFQIPCSNIRIFYLENSPTNSLSDLEGLDLFPGNILHPAQLEKAVKDCQWIIHAIGNTSFDPAQKLIQWKINVEGTRNVLEACLKSESFERLCYVSTVNALGIPHPKGSVAERLDCNPYLSKNQVHQFNSAQDCLDFIEMARNQNPSQWINKLGIGYFNSKLAAQELVNHYIQHKGIQAFSIYPGTMFGPYDYLIGNGMYLLSLYQGKMPAVLDGGLPLTHVLDVADACISAMNLGKVGGHYVLTGQEKDHLTLIEMCRVITKRLELKFPEKKFASPTLIVPYGVAIVAAYFSEWYSRITNTPCMLSRDAVNAGMNKTWYSHREAQQEIGYQPKRSFESGVDEMIDYYQLHNLFQVKERFLDKKN